MNKAKAAQSKIREDLERSYIWALFTEDITKILEIDFILKRFKR